MEFSYQYAKEMGSDGKKISWINFCVSTDKCSVMINGVPEGFFSILRCLRQEDPTSSSLFVLVIEISAVC